jgi:hypothetical protein
MRLHHDTESRHRADLRHHAESHHLYVLRKRYGIPAHLTQLVASLSGFGPGDGR